LGGNDGGTPTLAALLCQRTKLTMAAQQLDWLVVARVFDTALGDLRSSLHAGLSADARCAALAPRAEWLFRAIPIAAKLHVLLVDQNGSLNKDVLHAISPLCRTHGLDPGAHVLCAGFEGGLVRALAGGFYVDLEVRACVRAGVRARRPRPCRAPPAHRLRRRAPARGSRPPPRDRRRCAAAAGQVAVADSGRRRGDPRAAIGAAAGRRQGRPVAAVGERARHARRHRL
jgi:hypothetical protein